MMTPENFWNTYDVTIRISKQGNDLKVEVLQIHKSDNKIVKQDDCIVKDLLIHDSMYIESAKENLIFIEYDNLIRKMITSRYSSHDVINHGISKSDIVDLPYKLQFIEENKIPFAREYRLTRAKF